MGDRVALSMQTLSTTLLLLLLIPLFALLKKNADITELQVPATVAASAAVLYRQHNGNCGCGFGGGTDSTAKGRGQRSALTD